MYSNDEKDRLAIRELIERYSDAVNRVDAESWAATWSSDAVWIFRSARIEGRDAIVKTWVAAMAGYRGVMFMGFPGPIRVNGDTAEVVTHTLEGLEPLEGPSRFQAGQYLDRLVLENGEWKFAERAFTPRAIKLPVGA